MTSATVASQQVASGGVVRSTITAAKFVIALAVLLVAGVIIYFVVKSFAAGVAAGPGTMGAFSSSKVDGTKLKLKKYAYEAYPSWAAAHPDKACPDSFADLNEYMNDKESNDSWGRPMKMMCGQTLPPGAKGLAVLSVGEDGKQGTDDDLKSWE